MGWTLGEVARQPRSLTWACMRKVQHPSFEEASAHVRAVERDYGKDGEPLSAYKCDRCGLWHVGRVRRSARGA
jgi:hypothetical protein